MCYVKSAEWGEEIGQLRTVSVLSSVIKKGALER